MDAQITQSRQHFIQGLSRISQFWGYPKAMGAIFGALYLSPAHLSLDDLVGQVNVTKGAVSTNVRALERLGMVHKHILLGDRKDFYSAETDFWKIVKSVLREREKSEFDLALRSVDESLQMLPTPGDPQDAQLVLFYQRRLSNIQSFFHTLDNIVGMLLALDELRAGALEKLIGLKRPEPQEQDQHQRSS
jgi:DNA-binding transcriptional regulator GbsR (MarR family)